MSDSNDSLSANKHVQNQVGEVLWEGRPARWPFLLDGMSVFLTLGGGFFALIALIGAHSWWQQIGSAAEWGGAAAVQAVMGPLVILALLAIAVAMPVQHIAAGRRNWSQLRYVLGEKSVLIAVGEKTFTLPRTKIQSAAPANRWWPPTPLKTVAMRTEVDWKASGVFHAINETFSTGRVPETPSLYFIPDAAAAELLKEKPA